MPAAAPPPHRWGWHRLVDEWAARVVADAEVRPGELVLDIGAGQGALTAHLVAAGARVLAIELHAGRADLLRRRFPTPAVTVVCADAARLRLPQRPFRVVASPPYAIASLIVRALLGPRSRLVAADLVLPRYVVTKYATGAAPGSYRWSRRWHAQAGRPLPRRAFAPPPRTDSAILIIRRR